ncbi:uncharacterized protein DFL_007160 [Arthrobotrys flagrans]|uniref:GRF-type domain-containing protein n=1 Tax=Arthrobotrys flagrans TaxID=97331 RepID=A0A436ZVG1_ARTFL|nr:hypothetical protein DFL_007160 [Arthrobotrys flagrans]
MNGDDIPVDSLAPKPANASLSSYKNGIFVKNQWMCNCTPRLPGVLNKVRKMGKNEGRQFWTCSKKSGPRSGCSFFIWIEEARDRERKAVLVNGQMPPNKQTPSRTFKQTKISDSFARGKAGEGPSTKKSSSSIAAKGKAPVIFKEQDAEGLNGGAEDDAISIPSDIGNDAGDDSPNRFDTDSDGDTHFEDALGELNQDDNFSVPANGAPSPPLNPQSLPDADEPSEGPRKIARTKSNTSPSKHLLDSPSATTGASNIPPSTESTVADTPPIAYQYPDTRSMSSSAKERYARQWVFDSVDPVHFPDLEHLIQADMARGPVHLPPVPEPSGIGSSVSSSRLPASDPDNPLGPRSGVSRNGSHTGGLLSNASYTTAPSNGALPLEGKAVPTGLLAPSTPRRYTGIPGSPSSSIANLPVDITDEIFEVLKRAGGPLHPDFAQDIREILKKSYGKQRGYYIGREMARRERDELSLQLERWQQGHSENTNRGPLMPPPMTPGQSFIPATQSFVSPSQSFVPPPSLPFVPSTPTPLRNGSQSFNTKEAEKLRAQNAGLRKTIDTLRQDVKNAKQLASLHEESLAECGHENNQLHNQVTMLTKEIMGLKDQIKKSSGKNGEGSEKSK